MTEVGNIDNTPELRRRVQAARAYAGLSLDEFAKRVGIGRQTLVRIENGERVSLKRMELREMASTAGLPIEFFSVKFERLPEIAEPLPATADAGERIEQMLGDTAAGVALHVILERLAAIEDEIGLRDAARASNQALLEALDRADAAGRVTAARTRDASDATTESGEAHSPETPSSGQQPGG